MLKFLRSRMNIRVAVIGDLHLSINITVLLFLAWIVFANGWSRAAALVFAAVFIGSLALREAARWAAVRAVGQSAETASIYPFGTVCEWDDPPERFKAIAIAAAGPLISLALAVVGNTLMPGAHPSAWSVMPRIGDSPSFWHAVWTANAGLFAVSLIPTFPFDGGLFLVGIISLLTTGERAVKAVAWVGVIGGGVMFLVGALLPTPLCVVAFWILLVGLTALDEVRERRRVRSLLGHTVAEAMLTGLETITSGETIGTVAERLLHSPQRDFPVVLGDQLIGTLAHADIIRAVTDGRAYEYVAAIMDRPESQVLPTEPLASVWYMMVKAKRRVIGITNEEGSFLGLVSADSLREFVLINQAKSRGRREPTRAVMDSSTDTE